jgi:hypothetical protein
LKKITIIFIIVIFLLSFVGVSYLAEEPPNFSKRWNSLSDYGKVAYLLGLGEGLGIGFLDCVNWLTPYFPEKKEGEKIRAYIPIGINKYFKYVNFISTNEEVVIKVISDLYKDPANAYINTPKMSFLAYRKLKGESIESSLRELREEALR